MICWSVGNLPQESQTCLEITSQVAKHQVTIGLINDDFIMASQPAP